MICACVSLCVKHANSKPLFSNTPIPDKLSPSHHTDIAVKRNVIECNEASDRSNCIYFANHANTRTLAPQHSEQSPRSRKRAIHRCCTSFQLYPFYLKHANARNIAPITPHRLEHADTETATNTQTHILPYTNKNTYKLTHTHTQTQIHTIPYNNTYTHRQAQQNNTYPDTFTYRGPPIHRLRDTQTDTTRETHTQKQAWTRTHTYQINKNRRHTAKHTHIHAYTDTYTGIQTHTHTQTQTQTETHTQKKQAHAHTYTQTKTYTDTYVPKKIR